MECFILSLLWFFRQKQKYLQFAECVVAHSSVRNVKKFARFNMRNFALHKSTIKLFFKMEPVS